MDGPAAMGWRCCAGAMNWPDHSHETCAARQPCDWELIARTQDKKMAGQMPAITNLQEGISFVSGVFDTSAVYGPADDLTQG